MNSRTFPEREPILVRSWRLTVNAVESVSAVMLLVLTGYFSWVCSLGTFSTRRTLP